MNAERVPCKNPECRNTILPVTARANDGLCAPCAIAIRKAERDEYVRKNRRTVNQYESLTDPVEAIRIMLTPRKHDPLVEYLPAPKSLVELLGELTVSQAQQLAGIAGEAIKSGNKNFADEAAKSLATLTELNLDPMLHAWLDVNHLRPSIAFRNAGPVIRDRIFRAIGMGSVNLNDALSALAWIGDKTVQEQFSAWESHPPAWRQKLYVGPASYAKVGGWDLTSGGRRNLFYDECFALTIAESDSIPSKVSLLEETADICPWCGDVLVRLIEIPTAEPEFSFLQFQGGVLPVLTCERCACYSECIFARIGGEGRPQWHPANSLRYDTKIDDSDWGPGPWKGIAVTLKRRSAIQAADWCMELPGTQIGGMPTWIQDTAYPKCPDCSKTMMFLAQLDNGQFEWHEGIYYAFWCPDCRNTATAYQQT